MTKEKGSGGVWPYLSGWLYSNTDRTPAVGCTQTQTLHRLYSNRDLTPVAGCTQTQTLHRLYSNTDLTPVVLKHRPYPSRWLYSNTDLTPVVSCTQTQTLPQPLFVLKPHLANTGTHACPDCSSNFYKSETARCPERSLAANCV